MTTRLALILQNPKIILSVLATFLMATSIGFALVEYERDVNYISITGNVSEMQRDSVVQTLLSMKTSMSDIESVKQVLAGIGWIKGAGVALRWPDELVVTIRPQQAIAYWNDDAFINSEGAVFETKYLVGGDLPQLYGPVGSEQVVMGHYQSLNRALLKSGHFIEVLMLNERGALVFENQHGVQVSLGSVDLKQRLQRFLKVSARVEELEKSALGFDTRYTNGVAVNFIEVENFKIAETP
ncbi:MAG: hypothetical protein CMQ19_09125 [Gammaproteobacteria bacterium]|nr:hypothetical protein [Gammaproteobacteria bacterium]|tara:strand:+ start:112 stop:831 length:720 start_codon:yes stop_codon:yes gene_type:complete